MSDFFLAQMGDFFTEDVCFDASTEGIGGPSGDVPYYLQRSARAGIAAGERGTAEGPEPSSHGSSDPMREAGAPSTGKSLACVTKCCARPTGGSHGRTTDAPAQRGEGAKHRPRCFSQPLVARPEAV